MAINMSAEEIIRLHEEEGKTYKEIAKMLGTTVAGIHGKVYDYRHPEKKPPTGGKMKHPPVDHSYSRIDIPELDKSISIVDVNNAVGKIGDDKVGHFINYHIEMLKMRQGVDKTNVPDLYRRFIEYLTYCASHNIMPNNMNCYYAIGVARQDISAWSSGTRGSPEHQKFAQDVRQFFESIHEQAPTEGLMNPISAMFWQKAHDGMIEAQKLEVTQVDPLGDRKSAEQIAEMYSQIELPDD